MPRLSVILASLLVLGSAQAGEVFMTKDAKGNMVYTDRPESLPAQKIKIATGVSEPVSAMRPADATTKATADKAQTSAAQQAVESKQANEITAADKAKRCVDARNRYEQVMTAQRLYEPGASEGERRYLDDKEIDEARAFTKQAMDEFCADQ